MWHPRHPPAARKATPKRPKKSCHLIPGAESVLNQKIGSEIESRVGISGGLALKASEGLSR